MCKYVYVKISVCVFVAPKAGAPQYESPALSALMQKVAVKLRIKFSKFSATYSFKSRLMFPR